MRSMLAGLAERGSAPPQAVRDCFYNPSTTSWSPSPYTGEAEPVSATPASMLRILANPSLVREGLLKSTRAAGAPFLFDFLSYLFSPRSGLLCGFTNSSEVKI